MDDFIENIHIARGLPLLVENILNGESDFFGDGEPPFGSGPLIYRKLLSFY